MHTYKNICIYRYVSLFLNLQLTTVVKRYRLMIKDLHVKPRKQRTFSLYCICLLNGVGKSTNASFSARQATRIYS